MNESETTLDAALVADKHQTSVINGLIFFVGQVDLWAVGDTRSPEQMAFAVLRIATSERFPSMGAEGTRKLVTRGIIETIQTASVPGDVRIVVVGRKDDGATWDSLSLPERSIEITRLTALPPSEKPGTKLISCFLWRKVWEELQTLPASEGVELWNKLPKLTEN